MIKFVGAHGEYGKIFGFGISDANVEKLKQGLPILVDLRDVGEESGAVIIFHGHTEVDLAKSVKGMIGPDTIVHNQSKHHEG